MTHRPDVPLRTRAAESDGDVQSLLWRQLGGEVRPVADDQRSHLVIDRLDLIEGFNLATDGRKVFRRKYTASENLNGHG